MEYNQETIDKIRELMPLCMRKKVHENINKGLKKKNPEYIPYSTVCDVLRDYREGYQKRYRRLKVYDECVRILNEKGISIE